MIGREEQLQQVLKHIESVLKSTTQEHVLFITGEAGIGKSTFLKAVAEKTASLLSAPIVAVTECSTPLAGQNIGEAEALKPWVDAMDSIVRKSAESFKNQKKSKFDVGKFLLDTAPAWIELIPVLGTTVSAGMEIIGAGFDQLYMNKKLEKNTAAMSQQQIFQQYINLLLKISETSPLIIILDDFHWADDSSCNLLFTAARQLLKSKVVFIIAYRPDDVLTGRDGQSHAILHIKNELERYELSREITVPRLTANHLDPIMRQRFKNYVNNDEFEEWLAHLAGGNALFITQFLKTLEEDGFFKAETGEFIGDYSNVKVPKSAYAVVSERIRRLSQDSRELLQYASVEGEIFTSAVLSKITEMPQLKTLQKLRMVEEIHQIISSLGKQPVYFSETTAYRFSHALLHRALYDSLGEEERELLHEAILAILKEEWLEIEASNQKVRTVASRIAVHAEMAKDYQFAVEVLLKDASECWHESAETEAMYKIEKALNLLEKIKKKTEKTDLLKAKTIMLRAEICHYQARFPKSLEDYAIIIEIFEKYNEKPLEFESRYSRIYSLRHQGRYTEALGEAELLFKKATEAQHVLYHAKALYQIGRCLTELEQPEEAIEKLTEALALAGEVGDEQMKVNTFDGIGTAFFAVQDYSSAIEFYNKGLQLASEHYPSMTAVFQGNIGNIYNFLKDYPTALRYYSQSLSENRKNLMRSNEVLSLENMAIVYREMKDYTQSQELLDEALKICRESEEKYGEAYALFLLAKTHFEAGNIELAKNTAVSSKKLSEEIGDTFTPLYNTSLLKRIDAALSSNVE
ncbi:MAG: tetratricopeptide repeat protein [Bacteroidota bacterium]